MKNWKTTMGGLGIGLAGIGAGIVLIQSKDYEKGAMAILGGLSAIWQGWHSVDATKGEGK